ncbi:response regulator [Pedobacter metabolipauper]|uniref:Response regulator receiver domain-containing protein n=1 Tax=Pedobacter metabolipauper TaxID=425513 RepID=A0A4R6SQ94_9SPHI|nr:response regulator [Pedobacter metabolipauper]TDQ06394.1 response regulator receiver domain-containing protein [Pedobacter metabolipauper]
MPIKGVCEQYACSFFIIDRNGRLSFFNIEPLNFLTEFIAIEPYIGGNIEEIVAQKYKPHLQRQIKKCFAGNCFTLERKFENVESKELLLQIVFTPMLQNNEEFVICTILNNNIGLGQLKILNDYSHFTSHELRAPITNILSLSNITNYSQIESYDGVKINELLTDINMQAEKLDDIIATLNSLINKNETVESFEKEYLKRRKRHIVLVDDDVMTNKIHQALIKKHHAEKQVVLFDKPGAALEYIDKHHPDLILLDLHMPEIDGWRFLEMMQAHHMEIDVIIVSSSIDPKERTRAKSYEFVKDFVSKPLTHDKVKLMFDF